MDAPAAWARGRLPDGDGRVVSLDINGHALDCIVPAGGGEPEGATSFGLLAAALSSCTAMSVRTFLQRFDLPRATVEVDVALESGPSPVLHRRVALAADLEGSVLYPDDEGFAEATQLWNGMITNQASAVTCSPNRAATVMIRPDTGQATRPRVTSERIAPTATRTGQRARTG